MALEECPGELNEGVLQFDGEQAFASRDIEVGLSDGINIEVLAGLTEAGQIKKPQ